VNAPVERVLPARSSGRRAIEWLTRRDALAQARRREEQAGDERILLERGAGGVRAADRLLDPPDGSPSQPALAMSLYREAYPWILAAAQRAPVEQPSRTQLARAVDTLPAVGLAAPEPAVVDALALDAPAFAALTENEQRARARAVQRWIGALLENLELARNEVLRLRFERSVRVAALVVATTALTAAGVALVIEARRGPDLAAGKPWRASSALDQCKPAQRWCAGARTAIFFHTQQDPAPWLEIDLESVQRISRVEITNRSDFGAERALPLLVELSSDGQKYWPVARRDQPFDRWNVSFPPRSARYVRLTVQRPSVFHLERVSVRR
jgi:hypothetical protein